VWRMGEPSLVVQAAEHDEDINGELGYRSDQEGERKGRCALKIGCWHAAVSWHACGLTGLQHGAKQSVKSPLPVFVRVDESIQVFGLEDKADVEIAEDVLGRVATAR
jgi:hypothetical protein